MAGPRFSGAKLRQARRDAGFTESAFAQRVGLTISQLRAIEGDRVDNVGGDLPWAFQEVLKPSGAIESFRDLYGPPPEDNYRTSVQSGVQRLDEPAPRPTKQRDARADLASMQQELAYLESMPPEQLSTKPHLTQRLQSLREAFADSGR